MKKNENKTNEKIAKVPLTISSGIKTSKLMVESKDSLVEVWINTITKAYNDYMNDKISLSGFKAIVNAAKEVKNLIIVDSLFGKGTLLLDEKEPVDIIDITEKVTPKRTRTKKISK